MKHNQMFNLSFFLRRKEEKQLTHLSLFPPFSHTPHTHSPSHILSPSHTCTHARTRTHLR